MSTQGTIKRYQLILETLKHNSYPSFEKLAAKLEEEGFEVSRRTLQRNMDAMRYEYKVSIKYNRFHNGYYIDENESLGLNKLIKLVQITRDAELVELSLKVKHTHKYIAFENEGAWRDDGKIEILLEAIKHKKIVEVEHLRFETGKVNKRLLKPYLLKEYERRWYLVALTQNDDVRTYGLDRMGKITITKEKFTSNKSFDPLTYFSNVIGVFYSGEECQEVVLSVDPLTAEYFKTLPWHSTQEKVKQTAKEVHIRMFIHVNPELVHKILSQGYRVKVLAPKTLATEVKKELKAALKNYS